MRGGMNRWEKRRSIRWGGWGVFGAGLVREGVVKS